MASKCQIIICRMTDETDSCCWTSALTEIAELNDTASVSQTYRHKHRDIESFECYYGHRSNRIKIFDSKMAKMALNRIRSQRVMLGSGHRYTIGR